MAKPECHLPANLSVRLFALVPLAGAMALTGCATRPPTVPSQTTPTVVLEEPTKSDAWQRVANQSDVERIRRTNSAWSSALADARRSGFRRDLAMEGDLLKVAASLPRPAPTPGSYSCRLVRVGRVSTKAKAFERFKPFFCYVEAEGAQLTIVKQTGSQRPAGRLWEDNDERRLIFLGSLALASDDQPLGYGENAKRDMAGVLERIAPFRWRLVIPWPQALSKLDVYELTPVPEQPKAA
jgi:Domain of unknown function (DUF4893)